MYGEQKRKEKQITDFQTLVYEIRGSNKSWIDKELTFFGKDTEDFFIDLARAGFSYPIVAYFVGSKIDSCKKTVGIAGNFPFSQWIKRHSTRLNGWKFKKIKMRKALPSRSDDNDGLTYKINGIDLIEFWEDHFVPTNECEQTEYE